MSGKMFSEMEENTFHNQRMQSADTAIEKCFPYNILNRNKSQLQPHSSLKQMCYKPL